MGVAYFFMTSMLTLVMSTFRLNSGGNLVFLSSFASTLAAMMLVSATESGERRRRGRGRGMEE